MMRSLILMLIESSKYQPVSLRLNREKGFREDIAQAYSLFLRSEYDIFALTVGQFKHFWDSLSDLSMIVHFRAVEEDEEEYFQILFKTLVVDYFIGKGDSMKIFCLFCLYFFGGAVDSNGERNPRLIPVTDKLVHELAQFLEKNAKYRESDFVRIVPTISENFMYTIKLGIQTPRISMGKHGQIPPKSSVSGRKDRSNSEGSDEKSIEHIKKQLPELFIAVSKYSQLKKELFGKHLLDESEKISLRGFDDNIAKRVEQDFKRFQEIYDKGDKGDFGND